jgi:hypothetical protein
MKFPDLEAFGNGFKVIGVILICKKDVIMKKLVIPAIGAILLLIAIVVAITSPNNVWLYMLIGGIGIGILLGSLLPQRTRRRSS